MNLHSLRIQCSSIATMLGLAVFATGCAPRDFDRAVAYYADREQVRDAAARRTDAAWFLRFDAAAIYDLDAAIADLDGARSRLLASQSLTRAQELAGRSFSDEITRLSPAARDQLARRARCPADPASLTAVIESRAHAALQAELAAENALPTDTWRRRIRQIRAGVEPLPDDRARATRQVLLAGLAPAVSAGIADKEKEIVAAIRRRDESRVPRAALWSPATALDSPLGRWAPRLLVEWPATRDYPDDFDRIGAVELSGTRDAIRVAVDPNRPTLYTYSSAAIVHGHRCDQFNYVWWFSDRPPMTTNDAAAGHIDGGTLRLTLDASARPAIAEIILNCGCAHEVYVAADVEAAACAEFGPPAGGARFACESPQHDRHPILVAGIFDRSEAAARPTIILAAGTHEPLRFSFRASAVELVEQLADSRACALAEYDQLDRLPLGDGVASMFGPDGLVHFAGRREGYLLAPSGMLSAGQPRKRGTQRIRWDDYLFDDPTLLARTLRLPRVSWENAPSPHAPTNSEHP